MTLADSAGRIVIRRSVVVIAGAADPSSSTVVMAPTTLAINATSALTITVRDQFGNLVKTPTSADLPAITATRGAITAPSCTDGICTATYTAPATAGSDTVVVRILGVDIAGSPIAVTITP